MASETLAPVAGNQRPSLSCPCCHARMGRRGRGWLQFADAPVILSEVTVRCPHCRRESTHKPLPR